MPQASPELRAEWPGGDNEAISYLEGQGFTLTKQWDWIKPTADHAISEREGSAIDYLIDEWDFGGVVFQKDDGK
jgi:hypothetical protein